MLKSSLDPACTGLFSSLFLDYIHKKESVKQFYKDFPDLEQFKKSLTFLKLSKGLTTFEILPTLTSRRAKERILSPLKIWVLQTPKSVLKGVLKVFYASINFLALSPLKAVK